MTFSTAWPGWIGGTDSEASTHNTTPITRILNPNFSPNRIPYLQIAEAYCLTTIQLIPFKTVHLFILAKLVGDTQN